MCLLTLFQYDPVLPIVAKIVSIDELAHLPNQHGRQHNAFLVDQPSIAIEIWFAVTVIANTKLMQIAIVSAHRPLYGAMQFGQGEHSLSKTVL
jgi:hypothetical protein